MEEIVCFTIFLCLSACLATLFPVVLFVLKLSEVNGARRQPHDNKLILYSPKMLIVFGDSYADIEVNGVRRQPQDNKLIFRGPEKLFVFGDSYADTGNWPPTGASRPWRKPYAEYLGIGSPQPYRLWKGDGEAKQYGMNFAYGGAALVTSVGNDYGNYHGHIHPLSDNLLATICWICLQGMEEFVESITEQLSVNLKRIHEMGLPKVAVTAMQPLGCLPAVTFSTGNYPNCDEHTNSITRFHNQMLDKLNDQTKGSPFVVLDLYAAFTSALNIKHDQHPGKSSFPHPLAPCCLGNCGEVDLNGKKEYGLCDDPKMAFFWDMTQPSQQGWFAVYSALKSSLPHLFQPHQATPIV
ncbi:PREDICTED: GDSL esterase/lipase At5g03610-like [Ipomoea nil]|uniref:GDSL esterase/lipase At5g03610-like n=1 Tax=Ipomoea nil TaxID=35883 RepID=UPI0009013425|nr:PREDICTED: GDSL esterase/lipase At5g03610-like [Ipomoea nil]